MLARAIILILFIPAVLTGCSDDDEVSEDERQRAIDAAMEVYAKVAGSDQDLSSGPCIAEELEDVPGWSVDIAHDPRQEIDNQPENQCQAYRDGETDHFVELDPEGNLIRAE